MDATRSEFLLAEHISRLVSDVSHVEENEWSDSKHYEIVINQPVLEALLGIAVSYAESINEDFYTKFPRQAEVDALNEAFAKRKKDEEAVEE